MGSWKPCSTGLEVEGTRMEFKEGEPQNRNNEVRCKVPDDACQRWKNAEQLLDNIVVEEED